MPSPKITVGPSPIEGLGVFAHSPLHPGETILAIDDSHLITPSHPSANHEALYLDYLAHEQAVLMQPPERHINHSCDPNAYIRTHNGTRHVLALHPIHPQQEITCDYSINGSGDTLWTCLCGAPRCRHSVHSDFFHLPLELQQEYLPLLDEWFRLENREQLQRLQQQLATPQVTRTATGPPL